jgi:hypothetical protein
MQPIPQRTREACRPEASEIRDVRARHCFPAIVALIGLAGCGGGAPSDAKPAISGTPSTWVPPTQAYDFVPTASDADGDALTFSITGQPSWAQFDPATGRLWGIPQAEHAGTSSVVTISVSAGKASTALPHFVLSVISAARKARYGHHVTLRYSDTAADAARICEQPGVTGVVWRQTWYEVEPSPGVYDFSRFDAVLAAINRSRNPTCAAWLFVEFKSFSTSPIKNPCPIHLQARSGPNAHGNQASTCFLWEPAVRDAYVSMMQAAAAHYDADPGVEGWVVQETALGFNGSLSQDVSAGGTYTAAAWRDALMDIVSACGAAFSQSRCLVFLNFIHGGQRYLHDVAGSIATVPENRACFSGPDLLPDEGSLYREDTSPYEVLLRHRGCRANSAQLGSFVIPDCDLECVFRFGVGGTFGDFPQHAPDTGGLCVNSYLFWNHRADNDGRGHDWADAQAVIAAHPYGPDWTDRCAGGGGIP